MEERRLGKTNLLVSRMGLGLAALGRPGYINLGHAEDLHRQYCPETMEAQAHVVLDAARQAGVRYFDAARSYGRAEAFLSTWLSSRHIPPDAVTVGSKWGYTYTAAWKVEAEKHEVKEHSLKVLSRQVEESRGFLGNYLRLYQVHSATLDSGILDNRPVLEELARLRSTGLAIGLTLTGPHQAETLKRALDVVVAGDRVFDTVQATWNLLEQSAGPALQVAHDAGLGVFIKEALANGRLTPRNHDPEFAPQREILEETAERLNTTLDALALAAVLAQPWVDVVLSGAATVEHLTSNLGAIHVLWDKQAAEVLGRLEETSGEYWATRGSLAWN